ncbi:MAG: serine/threonine-protein kinase, partial [Bacteroidota bacterium]
MTPSRWTRIEHLFAEVDGLDPAERDAVLDREAVTPDGEPDLALREEVERLLALDAGADDFFDAFAGGGFPQPGPTLERVGPWKLLRKVGEGGMGEVYEAVRDDGTYRQRAAVKLVRPGLAPDLVARFRTERHVLARLDHPAIARLLDGGTAPDGRPYLATEFVDGEPITAYCDRRRLSVNERLALFGEVCEAVAAAHRQLVVHRDLKPSNVLVEGTRDVGTRDSGTSSPQSPVPGPQSPRVKLLDFGIAKLLDTEAAFTVPVTVAERR